jgi:hypothetical protein
LHTALEKAFYQVVRGFGTHWNTKSVNLIISGVVLT